MRSYPPAPWRLRGHAIVVPVRLTEPAAAGPLRSLRAGRFAPGLLILASYGPDSSLIYDEAAVLEPVRHGLRSGFRVRRIWVDDAASVAGGAEIWGLGKERARFEWTRDGRDLRVALRWGAGETLVLEWSERGPAVPIPRVPAVRVLAAGAAGAAGPRRFGVTVGGRVRFVSPRLGGDSAALGIRAPRLIPAARVERLDVTVHAPRPL